MLHHNSPLKVALKLCLFFLYTSDIGLCIKHDHGHTKMPQHYHFTQLKM